MAAMQVINLIRLLEALNQPNARLLISERSSDYVEVAEVEVLPIYEGQPTVLICVEDISDDFDSQSMDGGEKEEH